MAGQTAESSQEPAAKGGGGMLGKLLVVGFMGLIIGGETAVAFLFIPTADDIAARAEQRRMEAEKKKDEATADAKTVEVDLGAFSISSKQAGKNVTLRIDFHLYGTVADERQSDFTSLYERNQHRFREQILVEFRHATLEELNDPKLVLIKRRILEKSNGLFGDELLLAVVFSEFSVMEQ